MIDFMIDIKDTIGDTFDDFFDDGAYGRFLRALCYSLIFLVSMLFYYEYPEPTSRLFNRFFPYIHAFITGYLFVSLRKTKSKIEEDNFRYECWKEDYLNAQFQRIDKELCKMEIQLGQQGINHNHEITKIYHGVMALKDKFKEAI